MKSGGEKLRSELIRPAANGADLHDRVLFMLSGGVCCKFKHRGTQQVTDYDKVKEQRQFARRRCKNSKMRGRIKLKGKGLKCEQLADRRERKKMRGGDI